MLQHPVPPNLLTHIGDVTVSFALLESTLQDLLASQIEESQDICHVLTNILSFSNIRAAIVSVYSRRHDLEQDADFDGLKQLLVRAGRIEEERNRLTHSIWGAGYSEGQITRLKVTCREKLGFSLQTEQYDEAKLIGFVNEIKRLAFDISEFHLKLLEQGKACNNAANPVYRNRLPPTTR